MPVKPEPMKLKCCLCGYIRIYKPQSDCRVALPHCELCGDRQWDVKPLSRLDWLNPILFLQMLFR